MQDSSYTVRSTITQQLTAQTSSESDSGNCAAPDVWHPSSFASGADSHGPLVFNPHHPLHVQQPWESPNKFDPGKYTSPGSCHSSGWDSVQSHRHVSSLIQNSLAAYEGSPWHRSTPAAPLQAAAGEGQRSRGRSPTKRQLFPQSSAAARSTSPVAAASSKGVAAQHSLSATEAGAYAAGEPSQPSELQNSPAMRARDEKQGNASGASKGHHKSPCPASLKSPAAALTQSVGANQFADPHVFLLAGSRIVRILCFQNLTDGLVWR